MVDREHPLGFSDTVWINYQPVSGIYDRYSRNINPDTDKCDAVVLRRLNCQEEVFGLQNNSIHIEHHLRYPPSLDNTFKEQVQSALEQPFYKAHPRNFSLDKHHIEFYGQSHRLSICEIQTVHKDSEPTIITASDLRRVGSRGFYIENCGFKDIYPIKEFLYLMQNPQDQTIIICSILTDCTIQYATYCLSKITNAGPLAPIG